MSQAQIHARRWWILGVLILSLFTATLDNTILNVALPTLANELSATTSQLQWMVDSYILVFAGLLSSRAPCPTGSGDDSRSSPASRSSASAASCRRSSQPPTS